jgi:hypothetical protein
MKQPTVVVIGTGAANTRALVPDAAPAAIADPIATAPDLSGPHGRAWKCNFTEGWRIMGVRPEEDATLVHWLIEAPWAHPAWHSYSLVLVHLRPLPDGRDTFFYLPCASHEMWLWAIDAGEDRRPLIATGVVQGHWLQPQNFAAQFTEESDAAALARIERAVQEICDGVLSPDTDFKRDWVKRFGDNMIKLEYRDR